MEEARDLCSNLGSEEKVSATEDRKRLDCFKQMRFGRRTHLRLRGTKVKLKRKKRIEEAKKRKEGQFLSGRLRDTIDEGAEILPG